MKGIKIIKTGNPKETSFFLSQGVTGKQLKEFKEQKNNNNNLKK